ncbi:uncharacterized protein MYCFIDRAFT_76312 [Pseudocercospora fijiensis CIRAD86]|uniref:Uncharacterized protein n=1 Tax=Pseudocercospora fijiensis (strain CIRAD86) TaxID=383855 RepID=N1QC47_PSEFD|nr:uncharacterized protein MYCFIDRAFT_76312 [Pseudocercospora fijiensis CIRAD86]EME88932.1 hypothetical protein MYCFIDRAFT_76312 [Pseudocercospora fijiensis CIRAD86]
MIIQTTKATQADFVRDFAICSDDLADESDATHTTADEEDARSVDDHYRQSWKSLPRLDTAPGPTAETVNHYALSSKSLPRTNHDQTEADDGRPSPKHWALSQKRLPSSLPHIAQIDSEEAVLAEGVDKDIVQSCQDSASAISPGNLGGGPRKIFRHSAMTAEEQAHKAALLRGKIAEFDAAAAADQESCAKHTPSIEPTNGQINVPSAHTSETARKKRKSRQTDSPTSTAEEPKSAKKKAPSKNARKEIESSDESPSRLCSDVFLFSPLPTPLLQDEVVRTNRKQGKQKKTNEKDKILFLNPELQMLMFADDPTSITETMSLAERWKINSRQQLSRLVKQLEHYGIVPMGGVQDRLNHFGLPFENALGSLVRKIEERVKDEAAEEAAIDGATEILEQWVSENRLYLSRLVSVLSRSNTSASDRILMPMGEVVSSLHKDCGNRKDSAVVSKESGTVG